MAELLSLPIVIQDFATLHRRNKLYVDKTDQLVCLADTVERCFLSRPRRFDKSLTLSTLEAMFQGRTELFKGLAAEERVKKQSRTPTHVLRLDMSGMKTDNGAQGLEQSLKEELLYRAEVNNLTISGESPESLLKSLIRKLYHSFGQLAVLIDEYDKPILDNIGNPQKASEVRAMLQSFYTIIKSCDEYIQFLMLTGISKFSKLSIFSAMNNLRDISMSPNWGGLAGYTQEELEKFFSGWIDVTASKMGLQRAELLDQMKDYYDGFCFNGVTKLYNPFSVLNFFAEARFDGFWYDSGTPSFIAAYLKRQAVKSVDEYRHLQVGDDFTSAREIYAAPPESFLYQAGYLTMEKREGRIITLDYPNKEVLSTISRTFLDGVYGVEGALLPGIKMLQTLHDGDIDACMEQLNSILSGVASELFRDKYESTYSALFTALLRGAGADCESESNSAHGRCDLKVRLRQKIYVIEFKLARQPSSAERLLQEGKEQIRAEGYMEPHAADSREIVPLTVVFDAETHCAALWG